MDVRVGLWRKLSAEESMLLNCGVGEDSWESLGLQGDPTSPSEGDQPRDFFGRNDAKAETPVLLPPHVDSLEKTLMLGGIGGRRRKGQQGMRWLDGITDSNGREFEWTLGVGDEQGSLACCDSWGRKESDMTERLNWTALNWILLWLELFPGAELLRTQPTAYPVMTKGRTNICLVFFILYN